MKGMAILLTSGQSCGKMVESSESCWSQHKQMESVDERSACFSAVKGF